VSLLRKYYERRGRPRPYRWFYGGNDDAARARTQLTPAGIAAALRHAALLRLLCVDGFRGQQTHERAREHLATLLPLVGGDASRLDVALCGSAGYDAVRGFFADEPESDEDEDDVWCERLRTARACDAAGACCTPRMRGWRCSARCAKLRCARTMTARSACSAATSAASFCAQRMETAAVDAIDI
jgi:hypothetical protein